MKKFAIGDRVLFLVDNTELRGFITKITRDKLEIMTDTRGLYIMSTDSAEFQSLEKIKLIKAHSLEYLRHIPNDQKPVIF